MDKTYLNRRYNLEEGATFRTWVMRDGEPFAKLDITPRIDSGGECFQVNVNGKTYLPEPEEEKTVRVCDECGKEFGEDGAFVCEVCKKEVCITCICGTHSYSEGVFLCPTHYAQVKEFIEGLKEPRGTIIAKLVNRDGEVLAQHTFHEEVYPGDELTLKLNVELGVAEG